MSQPATPESKVRPVRPPGPTHLSNTLETQTSTSQSQPQPQIQSQNLQHPQPQTIQHGARPTITTPTSGAIPTNVRPGEYIVFIAPGPRQPGVQALRYPTGYIPIQRHSFPAAPGATIIQRPALIRGVTPQGMAAHSTVIPTSQQFGIPATSLAPQSGSPSLQQPMMMSQSFAPQSQMTPNDALNKGINFFTQLLSKMDVKSKKSALLNLSQELIDGKKSTQEFVVALQKLLNSEKQTPQLVPFLELALPILRQSMNAGAASIPGLRAPNRQDQLTAYSSQTSSPSLTTVSSSPLKDSQANSTTIVTAKTPTPIPSIAGVMSPSTQGSQPPKKKKMPLPPGQKSQYQIKKEAREARKREKELAAQNIKLEKFDDKQEADQRLFAKPKPDKAKRQEKQKKTEKQLESLSAALRDDDDVNDVAAMGGVNLAEESQKIMASGAELVGTQIRSCKDEPFFDMKNLATKIGRIVKEQNFPEPSIDVVTIISHALQERLKDIVERLGVLAEHRIENLKLNPKYEVTNDIKGQMKFLAELDRIEKRRYEEQERELLLRVAKSRSKAEDPEQQKLRQKAKDMQRAEQEEVRQREANQTALLAIGPRKKFKPSGGSSFSSFSQSSVFRETKLSDIRNDNIRRVKRVNMRDLQVLLELDRMYLDRLVRISAQ